MPIVNAVVTAAKLTSATYRIVATTVMGYYLVKGVADYEKQRRKESKNAALNAYSQATDRSPRPRRERGSPPEVAVSLTEQDIKDFMAAHEVEGGKEPQLIMHGTEDGLRFQVLSQERAAKFVEEYKAANRGVVLGD